MEGAGRVGTFVAVSHKEKHSLNHLKQGSSPPAKTFLSLACVCLFWPVQGTLRDKPQDMNCAISAILHMN